MSDQTETTLKETYLSSARAAMVKPRGRSHGYPGQEAETDLNRDPDANDPNKNTSLTALHAEENEE